MNYFQQEPEQNTFEALMVDVTHRCNMKCHNCYLPNRQVPDMDSDKLLGVLAKLPNKTFVRLIGAEPTMRSDLPHLVSSIKKLGHRVSVTTNGLKLADRNYAESLKKSGLRLVLLSMNGADEDVYYQQLDNMKCADLKVQALKNCIDLGMIINTGTIVSKGINEAVIEKQVGLFRGLSFRVPPVLRFRTIGLIGRNQGEEHVYKPEEFLDLICDRLNIDREFVNRNKVSAMNNTSGLAFQYENVIIRLVDWTIDSQGVPDPGNSKRGRITENWKIAPFFEDVKKNEFGF